MWASNSPATSGKFVSDGKDALRLLKLTKYATLRAICTLATIMRMISDRSESVESTTSAVAIGVASLFPRLSVRGAPLATPWLRFQSPLVEPDVQISRIRLSDKTSRLHPCHVVPKPSQAHETEVPVEVRGWIRPALASPDLVLVTQPPNGLCPSFAYTSART
jgi:hypothetical protein